MLDVSLVLRCRRRSKSIGTHSQYASLFGVHRSRRVARRCNPTHACCCGMVRRPIGTCLAGSIGHGTGPFPVAGCRILDQGLVWDVDCLVLPPCAPEVLDGQGLIQEVRPYRTSRFQSWPGVKVNIGEQREFRLASCPDNHFRCS